MGSYLKIDGTTGPPLGGFGAGAVKFCAHDGTFAIMTRPPADAYDYRKMKNTHFQLYTKRNGKNENLEIMKAQLAENRADDDGIWPLHMVNFGTTNEIKISLTAFAPFDNSNYDQMSLPYAFYAFECANQSDEAVELAIAFQLDGGLDSFNLIENKGMSSAKWAVYAKSNDSNAIISAGSDTGFFESGECNNQLNESVNKVAVKIKLAAHEVKTIQFVLAWYDNSDPERCYYFNLHDNPGGIAEVGLNNFADLEENAITLVKRMRNSNLPAWLLNQTLNTLANLTNNSMYKKDGRIAFAEGQWTCFGTMDQMWHARQIINHILPYFAWQELNYWARTQKKSGQIHHDFNDYNHGSDRDKKELSTLMAWDDTEHNDYRNIDRWVDLNAGFIISVYETYKTTNDQKQFNFLWAYLKKAGQRILDQVKLYGNPTYPYTFDSSENSYDAGGDPNPYNASLSAVAYRIMALLAEEKGENDLVTLYNEAYTTVVASFRERYLNDNFEVGMHCESYFAGQWLALHLRLGEIWTAADTDYVLAKLDSFYHPFTWGMGTLKGTYNEWTPYLLIHYGGLLIKTRRANQWYVMQHDSYRRQYNDRNKVFNHPLDILPAASPSYFADDIGGGRQYISMPGIWRNYYDLIGYYRDSCTKAIWLQPVILDEMNHQLKDALIITPEGYGSISCRESGIYDQNQEIMIKFDQPLEVSEIHLTDNFGKNVTVTIDGQVCEYVRMGTGYGRELVVKWNGTIDNNGLKIVTLGDPGTPPPPEPEVYPYPADTEVGETISAYKLIQAVTANELAGVDPVTPVGELWYLTNLHNFDYIKVNNVDFGEMGSKQFEVTVRSQIGGTIEVVLDSVSGRIIGNCEIPNSGEEWISLRFPIEKVVGSHDLVLRFAGNSTENLMDLMQFKFFPDDGRLDRSQWTVKTSHHNYLAKQIFDDDSQTRWHGGYQQAGKWVEIDLGSSQIFDKITLDTKPAPWDSPRGFAVYLGLSRTDPKYQQVAAAGGNAQGVDVTEIRFSQPQEARYIKIMLTEDDSKHYFSIYDLQVWNSQKS